MATLIRESYSENATIYLLGGTEGGRVMRFLCIFRCFFLTHNQTWPKVQITKKNTIEIFYYTATSFQLKEISGEENSGQLRIL